MLRRHLAGLALLGAPALIRSARAAEERLVLELKDGPVTIQLLPDVAPKHVERIKLLAGRGFYDGTPFHRVIEGFMAQGGDPTGTGTGGARDLPDLPAEFTNKYRFVRGVCGMARSQNPNSANSQFFIMFAPAPSLDGQYTIWGRVVSGMEAVDKIKRGDPARNGVVQNPDKLLRARIVSADLDFQEGRITMSDEAGTPAEVPGEPPIEIPAEAAPTPATPDPRLENTLILELKDGAVTIELMPELAPQHVERIKTLARAGFYDNTPFHRVIEGFMAQGGDPTGTGTGGAREQGYADLPAESPPNKARFVRGTCGMARTMNPNSANSQFFIMFAPAPSLDGQYTIWGRVVSGMEAVDKIKRGTGGNGIVQGPDRLIKARIAADAPAAA